MGVMEREIDRYIARGAVKGLESYLEVKGNSGPSLERARALYHLSRLLMYQGREDEALATADAGLEQDPFSYPLIHLRLHHLLDTSDLGAERRHWTQQTSQPAKKELAHFAIGVICLRQDKDINAYRAFMRAHNEGKRPGSLWGFAKVLIDSGDTKEARIALEAAEKRADEFPKVLLELATLEIKEGNPRRALNLLRRYVTLEPLDKDGRDQLSHLLIHVVRGRGPLRHLRQREAMRHLLAIANTTQISVEYLWIYHLLANMYQQKGELALASRWELIAQKTFLETIYTLYQGMVSSVQDPMHEMADMLKSFKSTLEEKEIITPEEFMRNYQAVKETRMLEEMMNEDDE